MPGDVRTSGVQEFTLPTRLVFGVGEVDRLGSHAKSLGGQRTFLFTDQGVAAAGHLDRALSSLRSAGLEVRCFDRVGEDPSTADVDTGFAAIGDYQPDLILGLGGGSSLDLAKACNFLLAGGGRMEDYWGVGKARGTLLPMIAVPTTAGTGTEVQSFALIEQVDTHQKMACGDPQAAPRIAVLDPSLTVTQPRRVTACTGLDAIAHAVETAVTTRRNAVSTSFSLAAFDLAHHNLPRVLSNAADLQARASMLRAAAFAGIAIEHSMLGAAHATANPLTARFRVTHGHAVGLMLSHVVRFNAQDPEVAALYAELSRRARICSYATPDLDAVEHLASRLEEILQATGLPGRLGDLGIAPDCHATLAQEASEQWTAQFNPRSVSVADFQTLFGMAS